MSDAETKKIKLLKEYTSADEVVHAEGEEIEVASELAGTLVSEGTAEEVAAAE